MIDRTTSRHAWVRAALLVGALYLIIGRVFALPVEHVRAWRLAAWLVSGVVFAAHIGFEHFRLRHPRRSTALHAAAAVALGAMGLTIAGMIHALTTTSSIPAIWFLALILTPTFTAVPAFLAALLAATLLERVRPNVTAR